jgi:flagellin
MKVIFRTANPGMKTNSQGKTMSTINTNVTSLIAQTNLAKNQQAQNLSLERLSTGLKINSGADDPAGLIASENLKSQQAGITAAIGNAQRATNIIGTAEGGLNEVSNLLTQVQSLVSQTANSGGLSTAEISANQLQVDSILSTINRIAGQTTFEGKQLLNGNYAYSTSTAATSAFTALQVNAAHLADTKTLSVVVQVTNSATAGQVTYAAGATNGGAGYLAGGAAGAVTLNIAGNLGTEQLSFAGSTSLSSISTAINNIKDVTGVSATVAGTSLKIDATTFGSANFVTVTAASGTFNVTGGTSGKASGTDAVVTVNGAAATASGKDVTYRSNDLDLAFTLSTGLNGGQSKTFGITGGGATFELGSQVTETAKASLGIQSVSTGSLGDSISGYLSSLASGGANALTGNNLVNAQNIINTATNQVSELRGRLGAFQTYTLGSTINSLNVAFENASSALSSVEDTDFAAETANLTRSSILSSAATTVLSQANSAPQSVLKLLG